MVPAKPCFASRDLVVPNYSHPSRMSAMVDILEESGYDRTYPELANDREYDTDTLTRCFDYKTKIMSEIITAKGNNNYKMPHTNKTNTVRVRRSKYSNDTV